MSNVVFTIKKDSPKSKKITVSFDAYKFEKIAADFGMFNQDFLDSLDTAEADIRAGKVRKIKSLISLRK